MASLEPPILGFAVACSLTGIELITSRYPRTFTFLLRSPELYIYCAIYGLIAFGVLLGFDSLVAAGVLKAEGLGLSHPWMRAIEIGVAVKALLHIRLFTVTAGSQPFPVGLESIVQLFEPWLLDRIEQDEFNEKSTYLTTKKKAHAGETPMQVKATLVANIRKSLPEHERAALTVDINKAESIEEAMTIYLDRFGKKSLERLFP